MLWTIKEKRMAITGVPLTAAAWTLVASGAGVFDIALRNIGVVKLVEASALPVTAPVDGGAFWSLVNGAPKRVALNNGENLYAYLPAGQSMLVEVDAVSTASADGALAAGTDRSGSIAAGGTAQQLAAANTARKSLKGQNISTGDLWINENGGTAAADTVGSYKIPAGATFSVGTNRAVSIIGAVTGQKFSAAEV
jgi:hypothetical protein